MKATVPFEAVEVRGGDSASFSPQIFAEQAVYQILYPISVPLIYILRGSAAVTNMRFNLTRKDDPTGHIVASFFQLHLALLLLASIGVFAQLPTPGDNASDTEIAVYRAMQLEVVTVAVAAIFQRAAVACKYAFLPRPDYEALMHKEATYKRLTQDQLIVGWAALSKDVLDRELEDSCVRTGLASDGAAFTLTVQHVLELRKVLRHVQLAEKEAAAAVAAEKAAEVKHRSSRSRSGSKARRQPLTHPSMVLLDASAATGARAGTSGTTSTNGDGDGPLAVAVNPVAQMPPLLRHNQQHEGDALNNPAATSAATVTASATTAALEALPPDTVVAVPAYWVARALLRRADDSAQGLANRINLLVFVAAIGMAAIPAIVRAASGVSPGGLNSAHAFIFASCGYLNFWFPLIVFSYLRVGLLDYRRRSSVMRRLIKLASRRYDGVELASAAPMESPSSQSSGQLKRADSLFFDKASVAAMRLREPVLPVDIPCNAVAFLATRRLLSVFGKRYFRRISLYTSQALLVAFSIVLSLLVQLLVPGSGAAAATRSATSSAPTISFAIVAIWDLAVLAGLLLGMLLYGARANDSAAEGVALLAVRKLEVAQRAVVLAAGGDDAGAKSLREAEGVLACSAKVLRHHAGLEPVTILSLPATGALVKTLAAGFVSGVGIGLQLLRDQLF